MSPQNNKQLLAELHSPDELLENAEYLFASNDPRTLRASVLEAITALESYVQTVVFSALENKIDPLLVKWLQEKTKMDFDSRLSILAPIAVGRPVDRQSELWDKYKKAKEIRNKVTHSGKKVSKGEARFVIDTVHGWLSYIGSTAELKVTLLGLKNYVENNHISVENEEDAVLLIQKYFSQSKPAIRGYSFWENGKAELRKINRRFDLLLQFDREIVLFEVKCDSNNTIEILSVIEQAKALGAELSNELKNYKVSGVVVVFAKSGYKVGFERVVEFPDQNIMAIIIKT